MFRQFKNLIPVLEKYECRDFTKKFVETCKYVNSEVKPEIHITKINDKKIPYNEQWENKDFTMKIINNK